MGKTIVSFIKNWILVIAMATGAAAYLIYHQIPALHPAGPVLERICLALQPLLLFAMLFLSFCKIEPHQLKPHRWQFILLGIQTLMFLLFAVLVYLRPEGVPMGKGCPEKSRELAAYLAPVAERQGCAFLDAEDH